MNSTITIIILLFVLFIVVAAVCTNIFAMSDFSNINDIVKKYAGGRERRDNHKDNIKDLTKHPRSKSEAVVIAHLESITGAKFPTVYPNWLVYKGKKLELDGYNAKMKIALEFSGPLHTKWNASYEPYDKYFERIVKDKVKRKVCKKHGVYLIVIDMSLPSHHHKNYLKSRIYDVGIKRAAKGQSTEPKPYYYIEEQKVKPYRNDIIERDNNLNFPVRY